MIRGLLIAGLLAGCSSRVDIAKGQSPVQRLLANDSTVFWISVDGSGVGKVMSAPIAGGTATVLADKQLVVDLAIDATTVYWGTADGHVRSVPMGGGRVTEVASGSSIGSIAVGNGRLYWVDTTGAGAPWALLEVILGGNFAPSTLALDLPLPAALRVDDQAIYWTDNSEGKVHRRALGGSVGTPVDTIVDGQTFELAPPNAALALDGKNVYWAEETSSSVRAVGLSGGAVRTLYTHAGFPCVAPVVDAANLYCSEAVEIKRAPLNGSSVSTLFSVYPDAGNPNLLALSGSKLVFSETFSNGDTIARVAK